MKLAALSLSFATLIPSGDAYSIPSTKTYRYEASVEHTFIPWLSNEWSSENVQKDSNYNREFNEASEAHSGGVGIETPDASVNLEYSTSWSNIKEVENKVETFSSSKSTSKITYQSGVRLIQRSITLKSCLDSVCNTKEIKDIVSYINEGGVSDAVRQYWTQESFRYLNAYLLPANSAKLPVQNYGYARYVLSVGLSSYRSVDKTWYAGKYGEYLSCPTNQIMTGICGSGENADCNHNGNSVYTKIQCSNAITNQNSGCDAWRGDNGNYGTFVSCPASFPFLQGYCGSGRDWDCDRNYAKGQCCAKYGKSTGYCLPDYYYGRWGQENTCPDGYAVTAFCGAGKNGDCNGQWTQIKCCQI